MNHEHHARDAEHQHHHHGEGHSDHSHHDHHAMMVEDFRKRFFVSLILAVPVLFLSPMIQGFLGVDWRFSGD